MEQDKLIEQLTELIEDLEFDYTRMSLAGQATYDEICSIIAQLNQ